MPKPKKMIRSNALADRLNAYKAGELLPEIDILPTLEQQQEIAEEVIKNSMIVQIGNYAIDLSFFLSKCVAFGYSLKVVFDTDWKFIAIFAIGFSIEVMTTKIFSIFRKD